MKNFKDFSIEDFVDMGTLPQRETSSAHKPFFGFNKVKKGCHKIPHEKHPVSNLADVL